MIFLGKVKFGKLLFMVYDLADESPSMFSPFYYSNLIFT